MSAPAPAGAQSPNPTRPPPASASAPSVPDAAPLAPASQATPTPRPADPAFGVPVAPPAATEPTGMQSAPSATPLPHTEVDRAWLAPGLGILERVRRTRAAARELGVAGFDAGARALLADDEAGAPLLRAQGAVDLAPTLPVAWAALAKARWQQEGDAVGATRALVRAVVGLDRHLEASLWWRATALRCLAWGLFVGALLYFAMASLLVAPRAAHDLGDRILPGAPEFARALLLGGLVLLPAALGEGLAGVALGLFAVAFACGSGRARFVHLVAAAALWLALEPVLRQAGAAIAGLEADPVVAAAWAVDTEAVSAGELMRLERAADHDPLAERALAVRARRMGNLTEADTRYARLLARGDSDAVVENNAANVRLALGDIAGAIMLYDRAVAQAPSAALLFNLSHAQGAAIHPDLQESTLIRAQAVDADTIGELTDLEGGTHFGLVVDLPIPAELLRDRLTASGAGEAAAAELRASLAPGRMGQQPLHLPIAFAAVALAAALLRGRSEATHWCPSCGVRRCPRCDGAYGERTFCDACTRLLKRPETADPALRAARIAELRAREKWRERGARLVGMLIPGAAGLLARRPLLGLLGAVALCSAVVAVGAGRELVPDPLAAGLAGRVAFGFAAAVLFLTHGVVSIWALSHRRD